MFIRDDGLWPEEMEVVGSRLAIHGPVGLQHAGLYECLVSYRFRQVTVKFNVTVEPHVTHVGRCNSSVCISLNTFRSTFSILCISSQ